MSRDEEGRRALAELELRGDLSGVPVEKLAAAARYARERRVRDQEFTGRAAAQMNRDGVIWERIAELLGMPAMTCYRWAQPFM